MDSFKILIIGISLKFESVVTYLLIILIVFLFFYRNYIKRHELSTYSHKPIWPLRM